MIFIKDFEKFQALINDLKSSGAYVRLYVHSSSREVNKTYDFDNEPPIIENLLHIAAVTSVGTIFIESTNPDEIKELEQFCKGFTVTEADISCSEKNGMITIK